MTAGKTLVGGFAGFEPRYLRHLSQTNSTRFGPTVENREF